MSSKVGESVKYGDPFQQEIPHADELTFAEKMIKCQQSTLIAEECFAVRRERFTYGKSTRVRTRLAGRLLRSG